MIHRAAGENGGSGPSNPEMTNEPDVAGRSSIDAERLAAYLDGRLPAAARADVLRTVAENDEDALVLADVLAIQADLELEPDVVRDFEAEAAPEPECEPVLVAEPTEPVAPTSPDSTPVISLDEARRTRRPGARTQLWAAAAVIAALAVSIPLLRQRGGPGAGVELVATLAAEGTRGLPEKWNEYGSAYTVTRGGGGPAPDEVTAARAGADLVDLELAVRGRQREQTQLYALSLQSASVDSAALAELDRRAGSEPEALLPSVARIREDVVRRHPQEHVFVGGWAEGARIAARVRNEGYFSAKETRRALKTAQALELTDAGRASLAKLETLVPAPGRDWAALEEAATGLLHEMGTLPAGDEP